MTTHRITAADRAMWLAREDTCIYMLYVNEDTWCARSTFVYTQSAATKIAAINKAIRAERKGNK